MERGLKRLRRFSIALVAVAVVDLALLFFAMPQQDTRGLAATISVLCLLIVAVEQVRLALEDVWRAINEQARKGT